MFASELNVLMAQTRQQHTNTSTVTLHRTLTGQHFAETVQDKIIKKLINVY